MRALFASILCLVLCTPALAADKQAATSTTQTIAAPLDINRASLDELKALKGIGDVRAAAIVKGRPYSRKDDLVRKGIVPQAVYDEIREQIIAKQ